MTRWVLGAGVAAGLWGCRPPEPEAELLDVDPERSYVASRGVLVTSFEPAGDGFAVIVDGDGVIRWSRKAPRDQRVVRVKAASNDTVLLGFNDPEHEERVGLVTRERLDGTVVSETSFPSFHHDLVELSGGRIAALGHTFADVAIDGHGTLPITTDNVQIAIEGGVPEKFFDLLADYPVAPYWTCAHMELGIHVDDTNEWSHTNSLVPTEDGGFLVMARYLDAIVQISPTGEFVSQLGGIGADRFSDTGNPLFRHAHLSEASPDRMLVFDNGYDHGSRPTARVVEIEVAGTLAREVWRYEEPDGRPTTFLGDAKTLPNGNRLIAWGGLGTLSEVTPDGDVVWLVEMDRAVGRAEVWERALP